MDVKRRAFLIATSVTFGLAGCTDDTETTPVDDEETTTPGEADDEETETEPDEQNSARRDSTEATDDTPANVTVQARSHSEYGDILVGPDEMTLYMFDRDTQGEGTSSCYDDCADSWPPLTVADEPAAGDGVTAGVTTFERDDGSRQVAVNDWPLYYFAPDQEAGDVTGQGVNDVWWVVAPDGTPVKPNGG